MNFIKINGVNYNKLHVSWFTDPQPALRTYHNGMYESWRYDIDGGRSFGSRYNVEVVVVKLKIKSEDETVLFFDNIELAKEVIDQLIQ